MKPHIMHCEENDCIVCESKLRELQEAILPLYIHIRYNLQYKPETAQERITGYQE
jgi:hypothetical protein